MRSAEDEKREWSRTAVICHTLAKGLGLKRADGGDVEVEDFMPQQPESEVEKLARLEKVMMAMVENGEK